MATRSRIAIENEDGTVRSIYSHWDGYPSHNGRILVEHYTDRGKVESLINLGSISSLAPMVEPEVPEEHSFQNPIQGVTVAYHRDRGEDLSIQTHENKNAYFKGDVEEYGYLFTKEGEWVVIAGYSRAMGVRPVKEVLDSAICD